MAQKHKPHSATTRKPKMNRPKPVGPHMAEYGQVSGYMLTSRQIPMPIWEALMRHWSDQIAVYMYPKADAYSPGLRPLEFGAALGLLPLKGAGQIMAIRLFNEDQTVPAEIEELGVVTSPEQVQELWEQTFDLVWNAEPALDTPEETEVSTLTVVEDSTAKSGTNEAQLSDKQD